MAEPTVSLRMASVLPQFKRKVQWDDENEAYLVREHDDLLKIEMEQLRADHASFPEYFATNNEEAIREAHELRAQWMLVVQLPGTCTAAKGERTLALSDGKALDNLAVGDIIYTVVVGGQQKAVITSLSAGIEVDVPWRKDARGAKFYRAIRRDRLAVLEESELIRLMDFLQQPLTAGTGDVPPTRAATES